MCGIAGVVAFHGVLPEMAHSHVRRFSAELAHRGPDGEGIVELPHAVLGHRRLAVLDLSNAARQPMADEEGRTWVVCNGEIYNHHLLRGELEARGHIFRSTCDTEVLVHGYEEWGLRGLVPRLRGMFAFALWDERRRTLWLVRDRLGVKPLFYVIQGGTVSFASEIRALYDLRPPTAAGIDPTALDCFLAFGYVPPDRSVMTDIAKVPPATSVVLSEDGVHQWLYWELSTELAPLHEAARIVAGLDETIYDAVATRLESDVPLGCFLSGGIDSGLIAGIAASAMTKPLTTLSVGFGTGENDELPLARLVAERYETSHQELQVLDQEIADLPTLVRMVGEPFADSSLVPTAAISRAARQTVTVALTGDGGDEVFGGYYRLVASYWGDRMRRVVGASGARLVSRMLRSVDGGRLVHRVGTVFEYGAMDLVDLYAEQAAVFDSAARAALYRPEWLHDRRTETARDVITSRARTVAGLPLADAYAKLDQGFRLPGRYLVKVDVASSTHALECRSPFVDHYLVEAVSRLPMSVLLRRGRQKGLLRDFARRYLPDQVVRARKRGFGPDVGAWLRAGQGGGKLIERLRPFAVGEGEGPLAAAPLDRLLSDHLSGRANLASPVWSLLCLEMWWRAFITHSLEPALTDGVA